jgi:MFS family permease
MITLTVFAAGQMMTLLYDPKGLELFLIAAVLVSLGAVPVALSQSPTPQQPLQVEVNLTRLFQISPAGTVGCFAHGVANGAFWSLAPVFTLGISDDPSLAAWFMTSAVVGGAAAQWPLGYLSDRIGRRKTLAGAAAICAVVAGLVLMLAGDASFLTINLLGASWGFFAFPLYTIAVAHANDNADVDDYVMVSSGLLLMFGAGAVVGPFIASATMGVTGPLGLYWLTAGVHLLLAMYVVLRIVRRPSVPVEQHIAFSDALAITHTASHVYEEEIQQQADD